MTARLTAGFVFAALALLALPACDRGEENKPALPAQTSVRALLCRIDSALPTPACRADPAKGNRIAVTLIANVTLAGENSTSTVKETWATLGAIDSNSAVPLIA